MLRGDVWDADNFASIQPTIVIFANNLGKLRWTGRTFINLEGKNPRRRTQPAGITTKDGMDSRIGIESALRVALIPQRRAGSRRGRRLPGTMLRAKGKEPE